MGVQQADGLSQAEPTVSALRASIPDAEAFVQLVSDYGNIVSSDFNERYSDFCALRQAFKDNYPRMSSESATMTMFIDIAESLASPPPIQSVDQNQGEGL